MLSLVSAATPPALRLTKCIAFVLIAIADKEK